MIKLLIIDDSALMRRLLADIFAATEDFEVAVARSGEEALAMLAEVRPDVITLDVHMPGMDGLACLDRIMLEQPCPVVMVSALTAKGADETLEAMALGAVDFIEKPRGAVSLEIDAVAPALVQKVRAAASARISRTARLRDRVRAKTASALKQGAGSLQPVRPMQTPGSPPSDLPMLTAPDAPGLVLVGASTGGPAALDRLLGGLPAGLPWPLVIAQHMPAAFTGPLARRLDRISRLNVVEIDRAMPLAPGGAYVAKGDADVIVSRRGEALVAMPAPKSEAHFWHPSVDRLVESALRHVPAAQLVGVLMTGMGRDGADAMAELARRGGRTIAEAAETAIVWGMPGALVELGGASVVRPLDQIAPALSALFAR